MGLLRRIIDNYRQEEEKNELIVSNVGKIMGVERVIEGFFEKYPTRRLPQAWIRALEEKYGVSHGDVLNASRRVRRRMS